MLLIILLAAFVAKLRKMRVSVIFKAYALYPFFAAELLYIGCQASVMAGHYGAIQFAAWFKAFFLAPLVIPVIAYKIYSPALIGSGCVIAGTCMNELAIRANGGMMPVFPTLSALTGYFNESAMNSFDSVHCLGTENTALKFFCDYIDFGFSILSVGDVLIRVMVFLIVYYSIKRLNAKIEGVPDNA